MFQSIWSYEVNRESIAQFIAAYASNGTWAALFRQCEGYLHTELLRDADNDQRFITIDSWVSRADFERMAAQIGADYEQLDRQFAALTLAEQHVGYFELVRQVAADA